MLNASVCSSGMSSVSRGSSAVGPACLILNLESLTALHFLLLNLWVNALAVSASSMFIVSFQSEVHVDVTFSPEFCKRKMMKALY
jgi:hypothetical protein